MKKEWSRDGEEVGLQTGGRSGDRSKCGGSWEMERECESQAEIELH